MEYSFVKINFKKIMIYTTTTYEEKKRCVSKLTEAWSLDDNLMKRQPVWFIPSSADSMVPKEKINKIDEPVTLVCPTSDGSINELSKTLDKPNFKDNDDDKPNLKDMNSTDDNEEGNNIDFNSEIYFFIPWSKITSLY